MDSVVKDIRDLLKRFAKDPGSPIGGYAQSLDGKYKINKKKKVPVRWFQTNVKIASMVFKRGMIIPQRLIGLHPSKIFEYVETEQKVYDKLDLDRKTPENVGYDIIFYRPNILPHLQAMTDGSLTTAFGIPFGEFYDRKNMILFLANKYGHDQEDIVLFEDESDIFLQHDGHVVTMKQYVSDAKVVESFPVIKPPDTLVSERLLPRTVVYTFLLRLENIRHDKNVKTSIRTTVGDLADSLFRINALEEISGELSKPKEYNGLFVVVRARQLGRIRFSEEYQRFNIVLDKWYDDAISVGV